MVGGASDGPFASQISFSRGVSYVRRLLDSSGPVLTPHSFETGPVDALQSS